MVVSAAPCTKRDWHLMDTFHIAKLGKKFLVFYKRFFFCVFHCRISVWFIVLSVKWSNEVNFFVAAV